MFVRGCVAVALLVGLLGSARPALAQAPTAFTYQGVLQNGGSPANGAFDMTFRLFDAAVGGSAVGPVVSRPGVVVADGLFTVALDFGAVPSGSDSLWLEVRVGAFTLSPRQAFSASPFSLQTRGIYVDGAGRVGIGTELPGRDLDIAGTGATVRVASPTVGQPAKLQLSGNPGITGGALGRLEFRDPGDVERASIEGLDTLLGSFLNFDVGGATAVSINEFLDVTIGDVIPNARLHVTDRDIGVYGSELVNDDVLIEDNDAILGIYSSNTGSFGSGVVLGEVGNDSVVDKWGLFRLTTNASPELRVTYGTNDNYSQNPLSVAFVPGGIRFENGSVQRWAGVVDSDSISTDRGILTIPELPGDGAVFDRATFTIDRSGQSALVVATAMVDSDGVIAYRMAYRLAGTSGPFSFATATRSASGRTGEFQTITISRIIRQLAPGTYEVGLWMRTPDDTQGRSFDGDVNVIVF
jgi:hypothetical protein